jgi:hypothetical protein
LSTGFRTHSPLVRAHYSCEFGNIPFRTLRIGCLCEQLVTHLTTAARPQDIAQIALSFWRSSRSQRDHDHSLALPRVTRVGQDLVSCDHDRGGRGNKSSRVFALALSLWANTLRPPRMPDRCRPGKSFALRRALDGQSRPWSDGNRLRRRVALMVRPWRCP